jgi:hypothetical protein
MAKRNPRHQKPLLALVKAHGDRDEVAFMKAAYELIDELDKEGEETDELTHILGKHLANTTKGHSLAQERACSACGDMDGCHLWRVTQR